MKVYAVISEFNPFHNGHEYLIRSVKEAEDCAVVAIMSGGFTERGDAAIIDKYSRAEAAVSCGCDLVLELPAPWCFSGAELFALGGVGIADGIGVCDSLLFGSESGDITALSDCEYRLSSPEFALAVKRERKIRRDMNISALRADVYASLYGLTNILSGSNNLLALEYLHAMRTLSSDLIPKTVKRVGADYNDSQLQGVCSATAIRRAIKDGIRGFSGFIPEKAESILRRELDAGRYYDLSMLDGVVIAMLRTSDPSRFSGCMEMSGGLENKLSAEALTQNSIEGLLNAVKSKRYSESRVRRSILSMLLDVKMSQAKKTPKFTNLLAANASGRALLAAARKKSKIAILSKLSDSKHLEGEAKKQFSLHMRAERLYEMCCADGAKKGSAVMIGLSEDK